MKKKMKKFEKVPTLSDVASEGDISKFFMNT
jgi:hypothetical protein